MIGSEPSIIVTPFSIQQHSWLSQSSNSWHIAFANFPGQIECHYPHDKVVEFTLVLHLFFQKIVCAQPIVTAMTVFTGGSSSEKAKLILR